MSARASTSVVVLAGVRLLYGLALLLAPGAALGDVSEAPIDRRALAFARVLGARQVIQAAIAVSRRSRGWILGGAAVDATHAASMAALALLDPERRTLASANALGASAFTLAGLREARLTNRKEPDRR